MTFLRRLNSVYWAVCCPVASVLGDAVGDEAGAFGTVEGEFGKRGGRTLRRGSEELWGTRVDRNKLLRLPRLAFLKLEVDRKPEPPKNSSPCPSSSLRSIAMLFRKQTKYALRGAAPLEGPAPEVAEDNRCCICVDSIEECKSVTLRCCHTFYGQCLSL